jgi:holin-like protein
MAVHVWPARSLRLQSQRSAAAASGAGTAINARGYLVLLACQVIGELLHAVTGLPLSGPIIGMVLLLCVMLLRRGPSAALRGSAETLLGYLSLLFVPAAVGIMPYLSLLRTQWLPIMVALLVSSVLGMASAALIVQALNRRERSRRALPLTRQAA